MREIQGAIGYDCRRLEDGRRAVFRHTWLHKRARRDFFERADAIMVLQASLAAISSLGSHSDTDIDKTSYLSESARRSLAGLALPYIKMDEVKEPERVDYDALFDELDAIEESMKNRTEAPSESEPVGQGDGK